MDASRRSVADRPTTIAHADERALQHRKSLNSSLQNLQYAQPFSGGKLCARQPCPWVVVELEPACIPEDHFATAVI